MSERASIHRHGIVHLSSDSSVSPHASQAYKLVVALESDVRMVHDGRDVHARAILVRPDVVQSFVAEGPVVAFFAEPGSGLAPHASAGAAPFDVPRGRQLDALLAIGRELARGRSADDPRRHAEVYRCLGLEGPRRIDRRVERALRILATPGDASIASIAADVGISPVRLRHLVASSTGLSLRRHRNWFRTLEATERILRGSSIGAAAIDAGFADHAHYTRSFSGFFGRTPSSLAIETTILATYGARSEDAPAASTRAGPAIVR